LCCVREGHSFLPPPLSSSSSFCFYT
jgi:hypothetical protein